MRPRGGRTRVGNPETESILTLATITDEFALIQRGSVVLPPLLLPHMSMPTLVPTPLPALFPSHCRMRENLLG